MGVASPASQWQASAVAAQMLLKHITVLASRRELDMAPRRTLGRRRRLRWWRCRLLWGGTLRLWGGTLLLWWGSLLRWGRQRLLYSRWRCRNRRLERLDGRRRDLRRRIRCDVPQGGWPDQCGEHRAVLAGCRPALPVVFHGDRTSAADFCHAAGVAIVFDAGAGFDETFAE